MAETHYFGIRHHGPGSARSLLSALRDLQPDCLLVEGPPEAEGLLAAMASAEMQPPVALLGYCPEQPQRAVYFPFAEFSPEWQALSWALQQSLSIRFIDLPLTHTLAMQVLAPAELPEAGQEEGQEAGQEAGQEIPAEVPPAAALAEDEDEPCAGDPLDWLAKAAGDADGESWWNRMVEERGEGAGLFAAVNEAMQTLRQELERDGQHVPGRREQWREAYMRQAIREAVKAGHQRIAVVCGAWHLAGLQQETTIKADRALLKDLPKVKVQMTWIPWSYGHLLRESGYGAGIESPGWYEHLWRHGGGRQRTVGWLIKIARLMRERDLDCSSAHLIEAVRLAETLAALRGQSSVGLDVLQEAARTVLTLGDESVLEFIRPALIVGDRLGQVPADVPTTPLVRDLEKAQKSLRLKPEALERQLDLDLRKENDLARSHLLHRLRLLGLPWGELVRGQRGKGTFHENWRLQWQPAFHLRLVEAGIWGRSIEEAAAARAIELAQQSADLGELSELIERVLLAELPAAVPVVGEAILRLAALSGDVQQLLVALPPLANTFRYGNVRGTDAEMVASLFDRLAVRAALALPLACCGIDDDAAATLRRHLLAAHEAIALRDAVAVNQSWQPILHKLAEAANGHALLAGVALRLLLDAGLESGAAVARVMSRQLSVGNEPLAAAAWLEGFLNGNALVLLHDQQVWQLLDDWLCALSDEHFLRVSPMVRRSFATFANSERRELATRASQGLSLAPQGVSVSLDTPRAILPLPLLRQLMGITP